MLFVIAVQVMEKRGEPCSKRRSRGPTRYGPKRYGAKRNGPKRYGAKKYGGPKRYGSKTKETEHSFEMYNALDI